MHIHSISARSSAFFVAQGQGYLLEPQTRFTLALKESKLKARHPDIVLFFKDHSREPPGMLLALVWMAMELTLTCRQHSEIKGHQSMLKK